MKTVEQTLTDELCRLERELRQTEMTLWYAIKSVGGKVSIPRTIVESIREEDIEFVRYEDPLDQATVIEARRKK